MLTRPRDDRPRAPRRRPPWASPRRPTPWPAELKSALLVELLKRGEIRSVIVFTRTKHRANRLADYLVAPRRLAPAASTATAARRSGPRPSRVSRPGASRCWSPPTSPRAGSTSRRSRHVVNFDVPKRRDDYIHRVGRTAASRRDGRRLHLRLAAGGGGPARHRAGPRQAPAARDAARLRLREEAGREARATPGRASRRDAWPACRGLAASRPRSGPFPSGLGRPQSFPHAAR